MSHTPEEPSNTPSLPPRPSDITSRLRSGRQYLNPNILRPQATQSIDIPVETGDQITSIDINRSDTHTDNTVTDIEGYPVTLNPGSPTNSIEDEYPSEDLNHYDDLWMSDQEENLAYENEAEGEHQEEDCLMTMGNHNLFDNENNNNSVSDDNIKDTHAPTHDTTHAHTHAHTSDIANTSDMANLASVAGDDKQHAIAPITTPPQINSEETAPASLDKLLQNSRTIAAPPANHLVSGETISNNKQSDINNKVIQRMPAPNSSANNQTNTQAANVQEDTDAQSQDNNKSSKLLSTMDLLNMTIKPPSQTKFPNYTPQVNHNRNTTLVEYNRSEEDQTKTPNLNSNTHGGIHTIKPIGPDINSPTQSLPTNPPESHHSSSTESLAHSLPADYFKNHSQSLDIKKPIKRELFETQKPSVQNIKTKANNSKEINQSKSDIIKPTPDTTSNQIATNFEANKNKISPNDFINNCLRSIQLFNQTNISQQQPGSIGINGTNHNQTPSRSDTPGSQGADNFTVIKETVPPNRLPTTSTHSTNQADFLPVTSIYSTSQASTQATQADTQTTRANTQSSQANSLPIASTKQTAVKKPITDTTPAEEEAAEDDTEEMPTEMMDTLAKSFNSIGIKLEPFSGSPNDSLTIDEFIDNLNEYIEATGKKSPAMIKDGKNMIPNPNAGKTEKQILKMHLSGQAKLWLKQLATSTSYEDSIKSLKSRFQLTDQEKHIRKMNVYKMTQEPNETYLDYVTRVTDKARNLDIDPKDIITIATQGSHASIKPFITMNNPKTLDDLIKMPLARADHITKSNDLEFVNAAFTTQESPPEKRSPQKVKFRDNDTTIHNGNDGQFEQKANRYDYNDGPYEPTERPRSPSNQFNRKPRDNYERRQPSNNTTMTESRNQQRNSTATPNINCGRCNSIKCPSLISKNGICYAQDKICGNCGKLNHYAAVCRSPTNYRSQTEARFSGARGQNNQNRFQNLRRQNNYNRDPQPTRQNFNQRPQFNRQSSQNQQSQFTQQNSQNKTYAPNQNFNTRNNYRNWTPTNQNRSNNSNNQPRFRRQNSNNQQNNQ